MLVPTLCRIIACQSFISDLTTDDLREVLADFEVAMWLASICWLWLVVSLIARLQFTIELCADLRGNCANSRAVHELVYAKHELCQSIPDYDELRAKCVRLWYSQG